MPIELRTPVAIWPASAFAERPRVRAALEAAVPVRFSAWTDGAGAAEAVLVLAEDPAAGLPVAVAEAGLPVFVAAAAGDGTPVEVRLADTEGVDQRVRGVQLHDRLVGGALAGETLAHSDSGPVWTRDGAVQRVRCVLPELEPDQVLYALLSRRAIAAVALLHFLREVSRAHAWQPPPLRAAFVFDDPNLRWPSYGYIDYEQLVEHADEHGYHAAMAMIPIDATRPHPRARALFAQRPDRLSLVFHGNDHVKRELLMPSAREAALAMAAQALRRVEAFERRSGLHVDRVMMPPHGLCSEPMARALAAVGFDALSAIHPLPWTAEPPTAPALAAWAPAEFVGGCAVIPRIPLTSTVADIALRAILDHPMIVYGHHEDVAAGLEPLAESAARVNRVGSVRWCSVGELALTNFEHRRTGDRLTVRAYSRRLRVDVPGGVTKLVVAPPRATGTELALRGWSVGEGPVVPFGEDVALAHEGTHEVRLHGVETVDPSRVRAPAWRPWPKLRRAGTEARDRVLPLRPARAR